jgi:hypothetical protein
MTVGWSRARTICKVGLLAGTVFSLRIAPLWSETPVEVGGAAMAAGVVVSSVVPAVVPALSGVAVPTLGTSRDHVKPVAPCTTRQMGSPYIPLDSWMYSSLTRLYSLGYLDRAFLGIRPWTRESVLSMLEDTSAQLEDAPEGAATDEAQDLYDALWNELSLDSEGPCLGHRGQIRIESGYEVGRGMTGIPLHDSYHIGESITNDYGRPIENGFDNYSGVSGYATAGIFSMYARTEFQHAGSATGYSQSLFQELSTLDTVPYLTNPIQATIPLGPIDSKNRMRLMEGYVGAQVLGHVFSFGKQDAWWGPGKGGAYAYSNNAENIYSFRIDRVEPLRIPLLSRLTGPFRYQFLVGSLKGHTDFRDPWVHAEKISFKPTPDLEFGFERTVIWGGKGHVPITIHSFLKSFFSLQNVTEAEKVGRGDPGARFGAFDMTWRLPYLQHWLTFYTDSEAHDDVSPISAPRRADVRPGLYLSHVPGIPKLDLRVEAAMDDQSTGRSLLGQFTYFEGQVPQGYTNNGQIFGDWMGREAKGGQAWATWHLSGNEWIQANWRRQKAAKDFIADGTTINDVGAQLVKRFGKDLELNANFTYEQYLAPIYQTSKQSVTTTTIQLTWFPKKKISF